MYTDKTDTHIWLLLVWVRNFDYRKKPNVASSRTHGSASRGGDPFVECQVTSKHN